MKWIPVAVIILCWINGFRYVYLLNESLRRGVNLDGINPRKMLNIFDRFGIGRYEMALQRPENAPYKSELQKLKTAHLIQGILTFTLCILVFGIFIYLAWKGMSAAR